MSFGNDKCNTKSINSTPAATSSMIGGTGSGEQQPSLVENLLSPSRSMELNSNDPASFGVTPYNRNYAIAISFNCIVGIGCLGLPFAFQKAGLVLTTILLVFGGGFIAAIAVNNLLESMARADGASQKTEPLFPINEITYRKFDYAAIGKLFGGLPLLVITQLIIAFTCICGMWSYACVVASSIAMLIYSDIAKKGVCDVFGENPTPGCMPYYYLSLTVFGIFVLFLMVKNIGDQARYQLFLSFYRIVAFSLMFITLFVKVYYDRHLVATRITGIGLFRFSQFGQGLGPCLLAISYHVNMPDLLQPLETKKQHCRVVALIALAGSCLLFLTLGILGAIAFENVGPLVSIEWRNFTGCGNGWDQPCSSVIGPVVKFIVFLFPVFNVASIYPLIGITLSENIRVSLPYPYKCSSKDIPKSYTRIISGIIPLLFASLFKKLAIIFSIAGLFGYTLCLTLPFTFEYLSLRYFMNKWKHIDAGKTQFDSFFSNMPIALSSSILSVLVTVYAIYTLL